MSEVTKLRGDTEELAQVSTQLAEARGDIVGLSARLAEAQSALEAAKAETHDARSQQVSLEKQV